MNINRENGVYSITEFRSTRNLFSSGRDSKGRTVKARRDRSIPLSDCIVTKADGSSYTIPRVAPKQQRMSDEEKAKRERARKLERQNRLVDIQNALDARHISVKSGRFGYIGNVD